MKTPARSFIVEVKRKHRVPPDHSPLATIRNERSAVEKIAPLSMSHNPSGGPVGSLRGNRDLLHLEMPIRPLK
jgi:hypothetical protein